MNFLHIFKIVALFLCLTTSYSASSQTTVKTDTHYYFLFTRDNSIMVVDRETQDRQYILLTNAPVSMTVEGHCGYIIEKDSQDHYTLSVLDLHTHKIIETIPKNDKTTCITLYGGKAFVFYQGQFEPRLMVLQLNNFRVMLNTAVKYIATSMVIHEGMGYIQNNLTGFRPIVVFNLRTLETEGVIELDVPFLKTMSIHKNFGYCLDEQNRYLIIVDLKNKKCHKIIDFITENIVSGYECNLFFYGDYVYFMSRHSNILVVMDVKTHTIIDNIHIREPEFATIHKSKGYILSGPELQILNTDGNYIQDKINLNKICNNIIIHENTAYLIVAYTYKIILVDLKTFKVMDEIENPSNCPLFFSDHHFYVGTRSMQLPHNSKPLYSMDLFTDFEGIAGDLFCDPDATFSAFENSLAARKNDEAKNHFHNALAAGSQKANAITAFAFGNGCFGAEVNDPLFFEFYQNADKDYLKSFSALYSN